MIEAFEIGVSLALQDGVSESISKAQRDVAALRRALTESGVSVQSLQSAAALAVSPPIADRRQMAVAKLAKRDAPELPAAPDGDRGAETGEAAAQIAVPAMIAPAAANTAAPVPWQGAPPGALVPDVRETFTDVEAVHGAQASSVGQVIGNGATQAPVAPLRVDPGYWVPVKAAAPVAPLLHGLQAFSAPVEATSAQNYAAPLAVSPEPAGEAEYLQWRRGEAREIEEDLAAGGATVCLFNSPDLHGNDSVADAVAGLPPAPTSPWFETAPGRGDDTTDRPWNGLSAPAAVAKPGAPVGAAQGQPAAPPAQRRESGPSSGDVFLDGMLVGRWMSRYLNHEAGRASAGPTGFDPRRGRLLPGVTVGG